MGVSKSPDQFVKKIQALGTATERRQRATVTEGALTAKTIMVAAAGAKGLSPGSKIAGRRWNVRYDIRNERTAIVRNVGPFHLFDNPTDPHEITPKRDRSGRARRGRGGKRALTIGNNVRASATHPGTPGARSFPAAKTIAGQRVPRVMAASIKAGWRSVLG